MVAHSRHSGITRLYVCRYFFSLVYKDQVGLLKKHQTVSSRKKRSVYPGYSAATENSDGILIYTPP